MKRVWPWTALLLVLTAWLYRRHRRQDYEALGYIDWRKARRYE